MSYFGVIEPQKIHIDHLKVEVNFPSYNYYILDLILADFSYYRLEGNYYISKKKLKAIMVLAFLYNVFLHCV